LPQEGTPRQLVHPKLRRAGSVSFCPLCYPTLHPVFDSLSLSLVGQVIHRNIGPGPVMVSFPLVELRGEEVRVAPCQVSAFPMDLTLWKLQ
jgi:hypothetical protein